MAFVLVYNLAAKAQSDAAAFFFGGEKGDENLRQHVFRDARTIVGYRYFYLPGGVFGHSEGEAGRGRIAHGL